MTGYRLLLPPRLDAPQYENGMFRRLFYREYLEEIKKIPGCEPERPIKETIRSVIRGCRAILEVQEERKLVEQNIPIVLELIGDFCRKARNVERRIKHLAAQYKVEYNWSVAYFLGGGDVKEMCKCCSSIKDCLSDVIEVEEAVKTHPIEDCYDWQHIVEAFEKIRHWMHPRGFSLIERAFQIYGHQEADLHKKFKQVMDLVSSDRIRSVNDLLKIESNFNAWWDDKEGKRPLL